MDSYLHVITYLETITSSDAWWWSERSLCLYSTFAK